MRKHKWADSARKKTLQMLERSRENNDNEIRLDYKLDLVRTTGPIFPPFVSIAKYCRAGPRDRLIVVFSYLKANIILRKFITPIDILDPAEPVRLLDPSSRSCFVFTRLPFIIAPD